MWNFYNKANNCAEIVQIKKFHEEQRMKVRKEQLVEKLLLQELVDKIKMNQSKYDDCFVLISNAQAELLSKDKRKKKENLKSLEDIIRKDFFGDIEFKIDDIISCGMDTYAWQISFKMNDKLYELQIPYVRGITTETVAYAHYGAFALYEKTDCMTWTQIFGSYYIEEIAEELKRIAEDKING